MLIAIAERSPRLLERRERFGKRATHAQPFEAAHEEIAFSPFDARFLAHAKPGRLAIAPLAGIARVVGQPHRAEQFDRARRVYVDDAVVGEDWPYCKGAAADDIERCAGGDGDVAKERVC